MMKFSINKKYNGKTGRVLNNQHLKIPQPSDENRESLNFAFLFSQLCKNGHSSFFPWGLQIIS